MYLEVFSIHKDIWFVIAMAMAGTCYGLQKQKCQLYVEGSAIMTKQDVIKLIEKHGIDSLIKNSEIFLYCFNCPLYNKDCEHDSNFTCTYSLNIFYSNYKKKLNMIEQWKRMN